MVPYSEHGIIEPEYKRLPVGEDIAESPVNQAMALVIENSPHPIIITEMSGKIHFFNSAAGEFVTTEEGAVLENFFDMDFGDKSKEILRKLTTEERDRTKKEETVEITNARGERRLLNIRIITFSEQFDKFRCYIFVDNTEMILSEKALIRSENEKTLILNSIHENLVYYDRDFKIVWANQDPANSLGMNPKDLEGKICYELWYGLDAPCSDCTIIKAMESGKPLVEEKIKPSGKSVKVAAYPVFDDYGVVIGAVESVLDISRRKNAEMALEETLKKYRELFETMTNGFVLHEIITDESGRPYNFRFLDVNPAFEDMTGLFSAEIVGKTVLDLFPEYNSDWIERYGRVALTGTPEEFSDYNRAFGKYYHIYAYSPKKGQFAAIFSDISDIVALKKKQNQLMLQINRNFEQLAILNDEIRNPLQIITGYAAMENSECSDKIMSQIYAIDKLINELDNRWLESDKIREYLMKHHSLY